MEEGKLKKVKYPTVSSQLSLAPLDEKERMVKPSEYNELITLLASKKRIIEEIRYECMKNKEVVPTFKLRRILGSTIAD